MLAILACTGECDARRLVLGVGWLGFCEVVYNLRRLSTRLCRLFFLVNDPIGNGREEETLSREIAIHCDLTYSQPAWVALPITMACQKRC